MLAAQKERLENLVKAGLLAQEQLETRLRLMEQRQQSPRSDVDAVHQQWLQSYLHDFTVNKILKLEISHLSHGLIRNRH